MHQPSKSEEVMNLPPSQHALSENNLPNNDGMLEVQSQKGTADFKPRQDEEEDTIEDSAELTASIFDVSLLLFVEGMGSCCSIFSVALLILNIVMQVSFAFVVRIGLTTAAFTDSTIRDYVHWRLNIAHQ